jgi:hypothetical protein
VAESPPYNQVFYTSAAPNDVLNQLSLIRPPGWYSVAGGPSTIIWIHKYMTQAVLIVGVVLLVTTCIGGLLLLARSDESLTGNVTIDGGRTKVLLTGVADQYMSSALFQALNQLPPA